MLQLAKGGDGMAWQLGAPGTAGNGGCLIWTCCLCCRARGAGQQGAPHPPVKGGGPAAAALGNLQGAPSGRGCAAAAGAHASSGWVLHSPCAGASASLILGWCAVTPSLWQSPTLLRSRPVSLPPAGAGHTNALPPVQLLLPPAVMAHALDLVGRSLEGGAWQEPCGALSHGSAAAAEGPCMAQLVERLLEVHQACFQVGFLGSGSTRCGDAVWEAAHVSKFGRCCAAGAAAACQV